MDSDRPLNDLRLDPNTNPPSSYRGSEAPPANFGVLPDPALAHVPRECDDSSTLDASRLPPTRARARSMEAFTVPAPSPKARPGSHHERESSSLQESLPSAAAQLPSMQESEQEAIILVDPADKSDSSLSFVNKSDSSYWVLLSDSMEMMRDDSMEKIRGAFSFTSDDLPPLEEVPQEGSYAQSSGMELAQHD